MVVLDGDGIYVGKEVMCECRAGEFLIEGERKGK